MGGGSKGKKDQAYVALQRLMEEPGSDHVILQDLLHSIDDSPRSQLVRALAGTPQFDDRAVAIVFGAMLERSLEIAIRTHFAIKEEEARRLFSYTDDGPLASFSAKTAMGYALGLYCEKMYRDLKWIARIRNAFAHARVEVGFHAGAIIGACDQLTMPYRPKSGEPDVGIAKTPRQRFTACVGMMALYLRQGPPGPLKFKGSAVYRAMYGGPPSSPAKS
jgi:hypothetical protein